MPRPAIDTVATATFTATGTRKRPGKPDEPLTWSQAFTRILDKAPASVSNPVRRDKTRAERAYTRQASLLLGGFGEVTLKRVLSNGNVDSIATLSGHVTTPRGNATTVDHTEALRILNDARMRALGGLSSSKSQFNVAAHELKGTLKSFDGFCKKAVEGIVKVGKQLGKKNPNYYLPPGAWKDVPGDYLGYLYGLKPLADDVGNGLDQLSGLSKRGMAFGYEIKSGGARTTRFSEMVSTPAYLNPFAALGATRRSFGRMCYRYRFPQWWIDNVPIVTPFSDAWELTRYSFVLDWALPIGSYVSALEAAQFDPYFYEGFEVYGTEELVTGPFEGTRNPRYYVDSMKNESYKNRRYQMSRTALGQGSRPTYRTVFPSFRKFLDVDKTAQSLSLLSQAFKTPPSSYR